MVLIAVSLRNTCFLILKNQYQVINYKLLTYILNLKSQNFYSFFLFIEITFLNKLTIVFSFKFPFLEICLKHSHCFIIMVTTFVSMIFFLVLFLITFFIPCPFLLKKFIPCIFRLAGYIIK